MPALLTGEVYRVKEFDLLQATLSLGSWDHLIVLPAMTFALATGPRCALCLCTVLAPGGHWLYLTGRFLCMVSMCVTSTPFPLSEKSLLARSNTCHLIPVDTKQISAKEILHQLTVSLV